MGYLKRLLTLLKPYIFLAILAFVLLLAFTFADYVFPYILKLIIDFGIEEGNMDYLSKLVAIMFALVVARTLFGYFQGFFMEMAGQKIAYDLRNKLYAHMQYLSFGFFDRIHTGQIMSRMTGDIDCIREFLGFGLINLLLCFINFAATVVILIAMNWKLALMVMFPTPILVYIIARFGKRINPAWKEIREQMGKLTSVLQENVTGIRVVKAFAREPLEKSKFDKRNMANYHENIKRAKIEAETFPLAELLSGMNFFLLTILGGYFVIRGLITIGTFMAMEMYISGLIWPVRFSSWLINLMQRAIASAPRIFEIMDTSPDIYDLPGAVEMPGMKGHIVIENVSYNFPDGTPGLKDVNLEILPGEVVAIIGGTGSGKSTLVGLLPRFYNPTSGRILIDGVDIINIKLSSLRSRIGMVMQDTFLFSDTIKENIAYGKPGASMEEIENAAKIAQIHDFIAALPGGYETRVGERGIGLSGGQKQRIAIARAILTDPAILILDEATSSVDTATEKEIQAAMKEIMKNRTVLVIAQRLSTVKNADKILVLKDGEIVETGTHDELITREGFYSKIYELQFKGQEEIMKAAGEIAEGTGEREVT
ncbi:MAG: ABC transporter ATP-binding protein [Clostridiaceae bacterium]|nr:ABC transporter ATP-binding protein [Clostridiaceae bacterium]